MVSSPIRRTLARWFTLVATTVVPGELSGQTGGLTPLATVDVGLDPHQIVFSPDGGRAYVAAAGSDRVTVVDASTLRVRASLDVQGTPLGLAVLGGGAALAVTRFGSDRIVLIGANAGALLRELELGGAPSLILGPTAAGQLLVSSERTDRLQVIDGESFELVRSVPVGARPFPPSVTSDGRSALVPGYDDGTVALVDLGSGTVAWTVQVGEHPSGGGVLPGDTLYAVAVRGENRLVLVDLRSGEVVGEVLEGIGAGPFSLVTSPDLRVGFVNNTASHEISVFDLETLRVLERVEVPEVPIAMAVSPDGASLWVSSEGEDALTVLSIPDEYRTPVQTSGAGPPGTDIWVADLSLRDGTYDVGPPRRVTDRAGYDNQPTLLPGGQRMLFTSIDEAGQADIWDADLVTGRLAPFTRTPESEYSAALLPGGQAVSVIRVEPDSAQRLWRFGMDGSEPTLLLPDVEPVGYQAWADSNRVAVFVLGDPARLQLVDLAAGRAVTVAERIGRSLHYVPSRRAVSFVQFDQNGTASIRAVDVDTGVSVTLTPARAGSQDMAWTPDTAVLMAEGSVLWAWTSTGGWREVEDLSRYGLTGITRLAVSPEGDRLALVAER